MLCVESRKSLKVWKDFFQYEELNVMCILRLCCVRKNIRQSHDFVASRKSTQEIHDFAMCREKHSQTLSCVKMRAFVLEVFT
jgi:hypothetical protein